MSGPDGRRHTARREHHERLDVSAACRLKHPCCGAPRSASADPSGARRRARPGSTCECLAEQRDVRLLRIQQPGRRCRGGCQAERLALPPARPSIDSPTTPPGETAYARARDSCPGCPPSGRSCAGGGRPGYALMASISTSMDQLEEHGSPLIHSYLLCNPFLASGRPKTAPAVSW